MTAFEDFYQVLLYVTDEIPEYKESLFIEESYEKNSEEA